jgi:hypothetical protein
VCNEGGSITHSIWPQLFSSSLKWFHVASLFVAGGSHIPKIMSMYRLKYNR